MADNPGPFGALGSSAAPNPDLLNFPLTPTTRPNPRPSLSLPYPFFFHRRLPLWDFEKPCPEAYADWFETCEDVARTADAPTTFHAPLAPAPQSVHGPSPSLPSSFSLPYSLCLEKPGPVAYAERFKIGQYDERAEDARTSDEEADDGPSAPAHSQSPFGIGNLKQAGVAPAPTGSDATLSAHSSLPGLPIRVPSNNPAPPPPFDRPLVYSSPAPLPTDEEYSPHFPALNRSGPPFVQPALAWPPFGASQSPHVTGSAPQSRQYPVYTAPSPASPPGMGNVRTNPSMNSASPSGAYPPYPTPIIPHHPLHFSPQSTSQGGATDNSIENPPPVTAPTRERLWLDDIEAVLRMKFGAVSPKDILRLDITMTDIEAAADELECAIITDSGLDVAIANLTGYQMPSLEELSALATRASLLLRKLWLKFGGPAHVPLMLIQYKTIRASPAGLLRAVAAFDSSVKQQARSQKVETVTESRANRNAITVVRLRREIELFVNSKDPAKLSEADVHHISDALVNIEISSRNWTAGLIEATGIDITIGKLALMTSIPFSTVYLLSERARALHWNWWKKFDGRPDVRHDDLLSQNQGLRFAMFERVNADQAERPSHGNKAPAEPLVMQDAAVQPMYAAALIPSALSILSSMPRIKLPSVSEVQNRPRSPLPLVSATSHGAPQPAKRKREEPNQRASVPEATLRRWKGELDGLVEHHSAMSSVSVKNLPALDCVLSEIERMSGELDPEHVNVVGLDRLLRSIFLDIFIPYGDPRNAARRCKDIWLQMWQSLQGADVPFGALVLGTETQSLKSFACGKRAEVDVKENPKNYAMMVSCRKALEVYAQERNLEPEPAKVLDNNFKYIETRRGEAAPRDIKESRLEPEMRSTVKVESLTVDEHKFKFRAAKLSRFWDISVHGREWYAIPEKR